MNILIINKYLFRKGGDAVCTLDTANLLKQKGHNVTLWGMAHPDNPTYPEKDLFVDFIEYNNSSGLINHLQIAGKILYNLEAKQKIKKLLEQKHFDIVHINNFAHQISPSILYEFKRRNIPVVMTVHDYKLVCPTYTMYLNGKPCELCKKGKYYNCFLKKCSKNSLSKSFVNMVEMYLHHKFLRAYDYIDTYISPSIFLKEKMQYMGFDKHVVYLPHFIDVENYLPRKSTTGHSIVCCSRLSSEKGLFTLLEAAKGLKIQIILVGDGPLKGRLEEKVKAEGINNIVFAGYKSIEEIKHIVGNSIATIVPSEWYEVFGRTVIESFALGKPVIGAKIGAIPELVQDELTGYTFKPGDVQDLIAKINILIENPQKSVEMGETARQIAEKQYNSEVYYGRLMDIYKTAMKNNMQLR